MMKSARQNNAPSYPVTISLGVAEGSISKKLHQLFALDAATNGGIEALQLNGQATSFDQPIPSILGNGGEIVHILEPGFVLYLIDGDAAHDWAVRARASEDCIRLRFAVSGSAQYHTDAASVDDQGSSCTFIFQPAGAALTGVYRRGVAYRGCSLYLSRSFLVNRLGISETALPIGLIGAWECHEVALGAFQLDRGTLALVQRIATLGLEAGWARLRVQGLALTLIASLFEAWPTMRGSSPVLVRLRPDDRAALIHLRQAAQERCPQTIAIEEAVTISGLNRNKVHYGFKEMFGSSLQAYCNELRMQRAADMLRNSALPIARIAEDLGFSEATNFTAAFRRHFREVPSKLRRSSQPVTRAASP